MSSSNANAKNGIPHRKLTRLTLFRRSQESSIGQSIAFSSGAGSAFAAGSAMTSVEEVCNHMESQVFMHICRAHTSICSACCTVGVRQEYDYGIFCLCKALGVAWPVL